MARESALIANVPEAEPYVANTRARYDPSAALGVAAHVTILYPFVPPTVLSPRVYEHIRAALSSVSSFEFCLAKFERFDGVLYLAPEPAAPFIDLTERLVDRFPNLSPYSGKHEGIIPHLTVAHGDDAQLSAIEKDLSHLLPSLGITARCSKVVLIDNATGLWKQTHEFPLA